MNDSPDTNLTAAFSALLQRFWAGRATDDEPLQQWERYCLAKPDGARQLMVGVRPSPPTLQATASRNSCHRRGSSHCATPMAAYSQAEQADWLRDFVGKVHAVYDRARKSPPAVLADAMHRFWLTPRNPLRA